MSGSTQRRPRRVAAAIAAAVCLGGLALAGCGSSSDDGGSTGGGTTAAKDAKFVVMSVGTRTDGAFGQAWADATADATKETGAQGEWVGNMDTPDQYMAQAASYADAGYDLVVLAHGAMAPVAVKLAKRYPDTQFCVAPIGEVPAGQPDNLCVFDVEQQVGAFRSGVLAGLVSDSGVVASNQSLPIPAITRQTEAYKLGAQCVRPGVKVLNVVTNNDTDPSVTLTASEEQINRGADVLMGATGTAMTGMFQAAKAKPGTYAIGQYVDSSSVAPDVVLASNMANFQQVLALVVKQAIGGGLPPRWFHSYGLDTEVPVGYLAYNRALYDKLPAKVRATNEQVQQAFTDGKIRLPTTAELAEPGSADGFDVERLGCTPAQTAKDAGE